MIHTNAFKKVAVIVAGGVGVRMQADKPKQFLSLEGQSILERTIQTFLKSYEDLQLVLVLPADHLEEGRTMTQSLNEEGRIRYVVGGETRFQSVQNGLRTIQDTSIVFVHDAVRCLLSMDLIHRCHDQALQLGSAVPAIEATDSIRVVENELNRAIPRSQVRLIQTPQTFRSDILLPAYETSYQTSFTDEASVVEAAGGEVHLINGEMQNIKITSPLDLLVAAEYLKAR
jgi:2-C-methyl-D-erythritol 4-phosphate cytidylyltransferase